MAKITEYKELPLDALVIGKAQARTENVGKDINELVASIAKQGLLQPIVVCQSEQPGKWEILTGQRRFLAHRHLQRDKIVAAILDERVSEQEAKAISVTENLIRRDLSGKDSIDAITWLYNHYGSVKVVAEETGISKSRIREYVKGARLIPELKQKVDSGLLDVRVALRAQDASTQEDKTNTEKALVLAEEFKGMSGAQVTTAINEIEKNPDMPIDEVAEVARSGRRVTQVIATITMNTHKALRKFADDKKLKQDEAVVALIEKALTDEGLLE